MRRANGTGSVYKLKGRRRKPYAVMVTTGKEIVNGQARMTRQLIGTYATRAEAERQLSLYVENPYSMTNNITFEEVYDRFFAVYSQRVGRSAQANAKAIFDHFNTLHDMRMADIRPADIERCIENADVGSNTKRRMLMLAKWVFDYAIKKDIVTVNQALKCDPEPMHVVKSAEPFSAEEVEKLWTMGVPHADLVLMQIYTGMRATEFYSLRMENVDLKRGYIMGGSKTEAGTNRIIPIHSAVMELFERHYNKGREYLFDDEPNYNKYKHRFEIVCKRCKIKGKSTHSSRHTFATLAAYYGMNPYIVKKIMGHSVNDVTEAVYTHRKIEQIKAEIEKIPGDWWKNNDEIKLFAIANR